MRDRRFFPVTMEVAMKRLVPLALLGALVTGPTMAQFIPPGDGEEIPDLPLERDLPGPADRTDEGEAGEPAPLPDEALRAQQAAALAREPAVVHQVETLLNDEGYLQEPADGSFDDGTRRAIEAFQRARAIHATGEMDFETLAALGVISGDGSDIDSAEQAAEAAKRPPESSEVPKPGLIPEDDPVSPDQPSPALPQ